jgi:phage gp37-like protein
LVALAIGIVPDEAFAVMKGRARLCESLAVNSSVLVGREDVRRLEAVLQALVHHNDEILSAAVRRENGEVVTEVGDHVGHWQDVPRDQSIDTVLVHRFLYPCRVAALAVDSTQCGYKKC